MPVPVSLHADIDHIARYVDIYINGERTADYIKWYDNHSQRYAVMILVSPFDEKVEIRHGVVEPRLQDDAPQWAKDQWNAP